MGTIIIVRKKPMVVIVPIVVPSDEDLKIVRTKTNGRLTGNKFTTVLYLWLFFIVNKTIDIIKVGIPNTKNTVSQVAG